ncbi:TetR/AcrR family transcriptional regulator [Cyclobacterium jeungdonense]|uniref:TetR family transcriptional regulator C-terminal domain-containing protein n=1 Tax=Cyclobacterium jeungdonense TaxID=708087 RepID=A0ABT8CFC2_9BACT|nr:TetR family transcriptional regulator C-terminal domain-containing protein [Cyclobacterium jeungdonense]MDN3690762.1 TetR family transcriptional regulator C-terminal domain-containing protein [Cyclobacterium jeungdonense]
MTEKSKEQKTDRNKIIDAYINHVLETGKEPASVFKFTKELKMQEAAFYDHFNNFEAIKKAVWERVFEATIANLESQEVYKSYSTREKLLGFYFTWIEKLKTRRSYLLAVYGQTAFKDRNFPVELKGFKGRFKDFVNELIMEGKETEEIANRPYVADRYDDALWLQVLFIFRFWLKDDSPAFEKTDAAIEKSVNLAFDLMGKSAVDSFVDFAKFLFQSR